MAVLAGGPSLLFGLSFGVHAMYGQIGKVWMEVQGLNLRCMQSGIGSIWTLPGKRPDWQMGDGTGDKSLANRLEGLRAELQRSSSQHALHFAHPFWPPRITSFWQNSVGPLQVSLLPEVGAEVLLDHDSSPVTV
ncbi:hypothetical protein BDP67DRAFT_610403 [Colletotrichum lupini]|nr:hypothetical protein BDP67DRAFT_610403 [Colletotrichum lupini]